MMGNLILSFDGSCNPNPGGIPAYGWVITDDSGEVIAQDSGVADDWDDSMPMEWRTNNVAEWLGLIEGVRWLRAWGQAIDTLEIRGDSNLIINSASGAWSVKKPHLAQLRNHFRRLINDLDVGHIDLAWVPREQNQVADSLSKA